MMRDGSGNRTANIYDVAGLAGVSPGTVSRVFSRKVRVAQATRLRVIDAARELGYRPNPLAASLRGASSQTVGLLWSSSSSLFYDISSTLRRNLEQHDYLLLPADHYHEWKRTISVLEDMRSRATDAIVIQGNQQLFEHPDVAALLRGKRCLIVTPKPFETPHDLLIHDRRQAYYDMAAQLIKSGRKRLMHITSTAADEVKISAVQACMFEHGLDPQSLRVVERSHGHGHAEQTWRALSQLDARKVNCDAVLCSSDTAAVTAHRWLTEHGLRVPDDVALVGSNNEDFSQHYQPPLATVDRQPQLLAQTMTQMLLNRLEQPDLPPVVEQVQAKFVARGSCDRMIEHTNF